MALGFILHCQSCYINEFNSLQLISTHLLRERVCYNLSQTYAKPLTWNGCGLEHINFGDNF